MQPSMDQFLGEHSAQTNDGILELVVRENL
jgi:hypothetical protein